jgi:hypothetical protein
MSGETRFELNPNRLRTMSQERREALVRLKDEEIDCSDIPEQVGPPTRRVLGPRFGTPHT